MKKTKRALAVDLQGTALASVKGGVSVWSSAGNLSQAVSESGLTTVEQQH